MAPATVSKDRVAERAYEIYKTRGGKPGKDLDDWLQAEKELSKSALGGATVPFPSRKNRSSNSRA